MTTNTVLKKMTENLTLRRRLSVLHQGSLHSQTIIDRNSASPSSAPSKAAVFLWVQRCQSGKSCIFHSSGKVTCVKALIDDDARILLEDISLGGVSSILLNKLGYRKVCMRWISHI